MMCNKLDKLYTGMNAELQKENATRAITTSSVKESRLKQENYFIPLTK